MANVESDNRWGDGTGVADRDGALDLDGDASAIVEMVEAAYLSSQTTSAKVDHGQNVDEVALRMQSGVAYRRAIGSGKAGTVAQRQLDASSERSSPPWTGVSLFPSRPVATRGLMMVCLLQKVVCMNFEYNLLETRKYHPYRHLQYGRYQRNAACRVQSSPWCSFQAFRDLSYHV